MAKEPAPRDGLMDIAAYKGGVADAPGFTAPVKLSSNENCFGAPETAIEAAMSAMQDAERYPDGGAVRLRQALAKQHDLDPDRVVCGCGSDELLQLIGRAYLSPGDEVVFSAHGFLTYRLIALQNQTVPVAVPENDLKADVDAILASITDRTRIVFIANPNNPTGYLMPGADLHRLHAGLPDDVLLVIDAAYAEYVNDPDYEDGLALARAYPNVVAARTFSKVYGLAGLRIGWIYGSHTLTGALNRVRSPFNANKIAQAAALAALQDDAFIAKSVAHVQKWIPELTREISAIDGIRVYPSQANFVLMGFASPEIADAAEQFLMGRGLILRGMRGFGLPGFLRMTVGLDDQNRAVVSALREFMAQG